MQPEFAKKLGLTDYETKAYLALVKHGQLKGSEAAERAGIPNAKVYGTLKSLAEKNLAVMVKEKPMTFKAIEPENAIEALMDQRTAELGTAARLALEFFKSQPTQKNAEEATGKIELNLGTEQRLRNSWHLHQTAKKYYYMVSPVNFTLPMYLIKSRMESVKRGVDERFIASRLTKENRGEIEKYLKIHGDKFRLLEDPDYENLSIYIWDDKKFIIVISNPIDKSKTVTVTIDSSALAKAMKKYFLNLYQKSKPIRL